ncbi:hypothetical protein FIBSPDRAFT_885511 [Athelia psychrophila]|uniref:Uncharacterized protein n=1 Tax=Athelia psychrophila TaxID=1759441 RepID=A0A166RU35_9AGAM|nr:hypothetical protein FIBSPDRAFT_885511 [Fibularhizoctonia sp. CBS 109695]
MSEILTFISIIFEKNNNRHSTDLRGELVLCALARLPAPRKFSASINLNGLTVSPMQPPPPPSRFPHLEGIHIRVGGFGTAETFGNLILVPLFVKLAVSVAFQPSAPVLQQLFATLLRLSLKTVDNPFLTSLTDAWPMLEELCTSYQSDDGDEDEREAPPTQITVTGLRASAARPNLTKSTLPEVFPHRADIRSYWSDLDIYRHGGLNDTCTLWLECTEFRVVPLHIAGNVVFRLACETAPMQFGHIEVGNAGLTISLESVSELARRT